MNIEKELEGLSYSAKVRKIEELLVELKLELKQAKAEAELNALSEIKGKVEVGDTVVAKFKGEEITGEVVSVRDKTFSILTEDKLTVNGDPSVVSRKYSLILSINNEEA